MQTAKQEALNAIQRLSDDVNTEEMIYPSLCAGEYPLWSTGCC